MDNNTYGPYPGCRLWQAAYHFVAQAGVYAKIGLKNVDNGFSVGAGLLGLNTTNRSAVVVDEIIVKTPAAGGDVYATISHHNLADMDFDGGAADDIAPEKDPANASTQPTVGNVHVGLRQTGLLVGNANNSRLPGFADALSHTCRRGWVLGPGQILYVQRDVVTTDFDVSFSGRYYPTA